MFVKTFAMKVLVVLLTVSTAVLASSDELSSPFIIGGVNAFPGEFPFLVSLQQSFLGIGGHFCGAAILTDIWLLTSAQCLTEAASNRGSIVAVAGKHNLALVEASEVRIEVERTRWLIHPGWTSGTNNGPNDIGLARLASPLTFNSRIRPIRIPPPNSIPSGPGTLAGWGANSNGIGSGPVNILQKVLLSTVTNNVCRDAIAALNRDPNIIDDAKFCTGPMSGGFSACDGDFGGPFLQGSPSNEVIIGVATWGITPCGIRGAPTGVFVRVSEYSSWITANTGATH